MIERMAQRGRMAAWMIGAACAGWLVMAAPLHAQVATGTILGNVKDNSGHPSQVRWSRPPIWARRPRGPRRPTATASKQLRLLPVGNYKVEVILSGFKNFSQTGISLEVGRNARIDATIELGDLQEVVSVVGDAPLVETTSSSLSRTVGQNEVFNLPLVNRDLYSLLTITGGVTSNQSANSLAARSRTRRSTALRTRRSAPSTFSSMGATTPRACAAPGTRRQILKPCRNSG